MQLGPRLPVLSALLIANTLSAAVLGADWPMWRHDANRSAASPQQLPQGMYPLWVRELPPPQTAWPNEPRLGFDRSYEPVVMGKRLFVGSPNDGSVTAFDTDTGTRCWRFCTEGPVRFAPLAWKGKVYAGSDDGHLYCLDASTGALAWRVRGCPEDRADWRHLGNARLISFWPVRGGPVLIDDTLYFAAGIWPRMGIFIHALDPETGRVKWTHTKGQYLDGVRIDHNVRHEVGLSPQGYLAVVDDKLLVPNGRSMPARLDRRTGELMYYVQGYRHGDCRVTAMGKYVFVGADGVLNVHDGREVGSRWLSAGKEAPERFDGSKFDLFEGPIWDYKLFPACDARSVLVPGRAYGMHEGTVYAYDLENTKLSLYAKKHGARELKPARWDAPELWKLPTEHAAKEPASSAMLLAGDRLFGHAGKTLVAVDLPTDASPAKVTWKHDLEETPSSMLAADDKLFVVTEEGGIHCFGPKAGTPTTHALESVPPAKTDDKWTQTATEMLESTGVSDGYCVVLGLESGRLVEELLAQSELHVIAVDADADRVNSLRAKFVAAGLYGRRVEVFTAKPFAIRLPPYPAGLVVSENPSAAGLLSDVPARKLFDVLRPYGGVACLEIPPEQRAAFGKRVADAGLTSARVEASGRFMLLRRVGPLPGSAAWTHESGNAARTYYSRDRLVQNPLAVLWYGDGPGYGFHKSKDYGTGVKPQVVGGRLFAFQIASRTLHAVDVYTGRALWQRKVEAFTRYASMPDGIYVAGGDRCEVLDPATGTPRATFTYTTPEGRKPYVADIRVSEDVIVIATAFEKSRVIGKGLWDSTHLVTLDRETGKQLWSRQAAERFNNHAIAVGAGLVFCIDSPSPVETEERKRRGKQTESAPSTVLALDARTGGVRWSATTTHKYRTYGVGHWLGMRTNDDWLAYAHKSGLLLTGKNDQMYVYRAADGEVAWEAKIRGGQPVIVRDDTFINQGGHVFDIRSGQLRSKDKLFVRGGCNYAVAGEHLILLRDYCVSYVDLATEQHHSLRNIRSGCSNSLVAADGVLSVPCFSVRCVCNYPIQTSFAMTHMPETAAWPGTKPAKLK